MGRRTGRRPLGGCLTARGAPSGTAAAPRADAAGAAAAGRALKAHFYSGVPKSEAETAVLPARLPARRARGGRLVACAWRGSGAASLSVAGVCRVFDANGTVLAFDDSSLHEATNAHATDTR